MRIMSIVTDTSVKDHSKTINAMSITQNKKAYHDYFIEEKYEAGIVLSGWEVKAIRAGRVQLKDTYIIVRDGELWLLGGHISPLLSASTTSILTRLERENCCLKPMKFHASSARWSNAASHSSHWIYTTPVAKSNVKLRWHAVKPNMTNVTPKKTVNGNVKNSA